MSGIRARPISGINPSNGEKVNSDINISEENSSAMDNLGQRTIDMNESKELLLPGESPSEDSRPDYRTPEIRVVHLFGRSINIVVLITHINIFLYALCFWIQNAVFPYLSKQLGADPVMFGYLQTTFAVVQLAGGPLFGRFGDLFGSRLAMILAFTASAASYFFLFIATSIPFLFLSRIPSIFMQAMQGGQMVVTDVCDPKERANALAKLGLTYGLGMVAGTLSGGLIAKMYSLEIAALMSCLGSVVSVVLTYTFVPQNMKRTKADDKKESMFNLSKIIEILKAPGASFLMSIKLATGIPIGIFQAMFSVIALETFKLPADQNSYIMSYIGVLSMLVQGFGVNLVTKRFSDLKILTGSASILTVSYFMLSLVTNVWQLCMVFFPLVIGLTFQTIITTSALTNTVSNSDTGTMLGLSMGVNSLIRTLSPTVGGYMLLSFGFSSFGQLGFVTGCIVTVILILRLRHERM